eukprot:3902407-Rhodomonas_salina.4
MSRCCTGNYKSASTFAVRCVAESRGRACDFADPSVARCSVAGSDGAPRWNPGLDRDGSFRYDGEHLDEGRSVANQSQHPHTHSCDALSLRALACAAVRASS